jgi:uncharacterized protein (DUF736 family)
MIIGSFLYDAGEDTYAGNITTLTVVRSDLRLRRAEKSGNKGPDYRLIAETAFGHVELGAAWKRTSDNGRDFLSVAIDDPALPGPLSAALFTDENGENASLVWNRQKPKASAEAKEAPAKKPTKKAA